MIIIPIKWLFHWEYTLFSDKPMWGVRWRDTSGEPDIAIDLGRSVETLFLPRQILLKPTGTQAQRRAQDPKMSQGCDLFQRKNQRKNPKRKSFEEMTTEKCIPKDPKTNIWNPRDRHQCSNAHTTGDQTTKWQLSAATSRAFALAGTATSTTRTCRTRRSTATNFFLKLGVQFLAVIHRQISCYLWLFYAFLRPCLGTEVPTQWTTALWGLAPLIPPASSRLTYLTSVSSAITSIKQWCPNIPQT